MKLIADTNIILRMIIRDDEPQARAVDQLMLDVEWLVIPLASLCEFAWVSRSRYRRRSGEIGDAIRALIAMDGVIVDRPAVAAGLAMLDAGGDFADGAIAASGQQMGGEVFASFDRDAVDQLDRAGFPVLRLDGSMNG